MAYTDIDNPELYFQTKIWSGNGGTQAITFDGSENMQPDWVWIKRRNDTNGHTVLDSVRGATKSWRADATEAEETRASSLTSFDSNGFTLGSDGNVNASGGTYVAWNWKAGTSVSGNTTGSGTAKAYSGSVNTDAGFSIIKYIGNGTSGHTIPHHLTVAPNVIITKVLNETSSAYVYHSGIGATKNLFLSETDAAGTSAAYWVNTAPSSSVFTVGDQTGNNANNKNIIAYCFADVQGYSKVSGSYIGNGSNSFIYTGFKVGWLLVKVADGTNGWLVIDTKRSPANPQGKYIYANANSAEGTVTYGEFFSNGFGWKGTNSIAVNQSGKQYIYYAIAENPFVTSTGVPATAR